MSRALWILGTLGASAAAVYAFEHYGVARSLDLRPWRIYGAAALGVLLLLPVLLYSLRKRTTYFAYLWFRRMGDFDERQAQVRAGVMDLQREVYNKLYTRPRQIRRLARGVLRAHGLGRYFRVLIEMQATGEAGGEQAPEIRLVKQDPMGMLQTWLRAHTSMGVVAFVVIALHSGLQFHGLLSTAAFVLLALVLATGLAGLLLFRLVAPRLTPLEGELLPEEMRRKGELVAARLAQVLQEAPEAVRALAGDRRQRVARLRAHDGEGQEQARALAVMFAQQAAIDAHYRRERRYQRWMHGWLALHIPLAGAMVVAVVAHALSFWYY